MPGASSSFSSPAREMDADPADCQETDEVEAWELARMLELEVPRPEAEMLVAVGVEWWEMYRLLEGGCPMRLALRILAP